RSLNVKCPNKPNSTMGFGRMQVNEKNSQLIDEDSFSTKR
ncbi:8166_t:CDS:1, partial [Gigaspora margarita]